MPDDVTAPVTAEDLTSPAVVGPANAAVYEVIRKWPGTAERNAVIWRAVQAYQAALMVDPATGRHPLDALTEVQCGHKRHQWMCVNCAADAMRPEVERLRAELAGARDIAGWAEAERDALRAAATRARGYLTRALDAWTTEHEYYQDRAGRKGYSHDETAAEVYGAAMKVVAAALAALAAPESHEDAREETARCSCDRRVVPVEEGPSYPDEDCPVHGKPELRR